ncbi:hypothetical protein JXB11_02305 [Candidatus Woesearchaeota archaeon]|nr:hypothetical protein [Candidatus Woesearchaeota archaeon]
MTGTIPVKLYIGRFSYSKDSDKEDRKKIAKRIKERAEKSLSLESILVRGTACSNVTKDKIIEEGTDRFGRQDTFAREGSLILGVEDAIKRIEHINGYKNGLYQRITRKGEKRIARHKRSYPAVLIYDASKLIARRHNDHYDFIAEPHDALLGLFYFSLRSK